MLSSALSDVEKIKLEAASSLSRSDLRDDSLSISEKTSTMRGIILLTFRALKNTEDRMTGLNPPIMRLRG